MWDININGFISILEFVDLYAKFVLNQSIQKEFEAFREGFELLCQDNAINVKKNTLSFFILQSVHIQY